MKIRLSRKGFDSTGYLSIGIGKPCGTPSMMGVGREAIDLS
jgi:hypothetical protein